jgi:hypothetical protein
MRALAPVYDVTWRIAGRGDFDGDGRADIFWRNPVTGGTAIWLLTGDGTTHTNVPLITIEDPLWEPVAIADFDGDGRDDIFWRRDESGRNSIWLMNGGMPAFVDPPPVPDVRWKIRASGDFNGDGFADVLWRNPEINGTAMWLMQRGERTNVTLTNVSSGWDPAGAGDFDGDGRDDVFWWNGETSGKALWLMTADGPVNRDVAYYDRFSRPSTSVGVPVMVGDFDGDGRADVLWRKPESSSDAYSLAATLQDFGYEITTPVFTTTRTLTPFTPR